MPTCEYTLGYRACTWVNGDHLDILLSQSLCEQTSAMSAVLHSENMYQLTGLDRLACNMQVQCCCQTWCYTSTKVAEAMSTCGFSLLNRFELADVNPRQADPLHACSDSAQVMHPGPSDQMHLHSKCTLYADVLCPLSTSFLMDHNEHTSTVKLNCLSTVKLYCLMVSSKRQLEPSQNIPHSS